MNKQFETNLCAAGLITAVLTAGAFGRTGGEVAH